VCGEVIGRIGLFNAPLLNKSTNFLFSKIKKNFKFHILNLNIYISHSKLQNIVFQQVCEKLTTISRVYKEWCEKGKTSSMQQSCG